MSRKALFIFFYDLSTTSARLKLFRKIDRRCTNWNCNSKFHKNRSLVSYIYISNRYPSYSRESSCERRLRYADIQYYFFLNSWNLTFLKKPGFFHQLIKFYYTHTCINIYIRNVLYQGSSVSRLFHNFRNVYYYFHNTIMYPMYVIIFITILNFTCTIHIFLF